MLSCTSYNEWLQLICDQMTDDISSHPTCMNAVDLLCTCMCNQVVSVNE